MLGCREHCLPSHWLRSQSPPPVGLPVLCLLPVLWKVAFDLPVELVAMPVGRPIDSVFHSMPVDLPLDSVSHPMPGGLLLGSVFRPVPVGLPFDSVFLPVPVLRQKEPESVVFPPFG